MEDLRSDMKDSFCRVISENVNDTIAKMVKSNCSITKRKTYIENFNDAAYSEDIEPALLSKLEELEQKWNRGETIRITRRDKEVVTLPKKGDFYREFEDITCHSPKKGDPNIDDLSSYIKLDEMACGRPKSVSLSDRDREMFWNIAKRKID